MAVIPARLEHDPAFRAASWPARMVYWQLHNRRRIERIDGCDQIDSIVYVVRGLSTSPREDIAAVLPELLRRGLLVEQPDGALVPKHAPQPRAHAPARGALRAASTPAAAAGDEAMHGAFRTMISRVYRDDPRRLDRSPEGRAAWSALKWGSLWPEFVRAYEPRPTSARPAERREAPAVTNPEAPPPPRTVTETPAKRDSERDSAVTAGFERDEREKSSLSLGSTGVPEKTSQSPREAEAAVTTAVTSPVVTGIVTAPEAGAAPVTGPRLSPAAVWSALAPERTNQRLGTTGKHHRRRAFDILVEEGVPLAVVEGIASLARQRKLFGLEKHPVTGEQRDQVSLSWALDREAKVFYSWIDQGKTEAARQVELGLAANDARTGAARAATPTGPRTDASTGPPTNSAPPVGGVVRAEPTPEQVRSVAGGIHASLASLRSKGPPSKSA